MLQYLLRLLSRLDAKCQRTDYGRSAIFTDRRYIYVRLQPCTTGKPCYFCHSSERHNREQCILQAQPAPLSRRRRSARIGDRRLHNALDALELTRPIATAVISPRQNFFRRRRPRGLIGHVIHRSLRSASKRTYECNMIVVMAT